MGQFSEYIDNIKTQTDMLRNVLTDTTGKDASNFSIKKCAETFSNLALGGSGTLKITTNGVYNVLDYANADVNIQPRLAVKEIYENGEYIAETENVDGYLKVIVNVGSVKSLVITLPDAFKNATSLYHYKINDNELLISADTSVGLWKYKIDTQEASQLYSTGAGWHKFNKVGDDYVIGSDVENVAGFLVYQTDRNLVTKYGSYDLYTAFSVREDKCLIACDGFYIWVYNATTKEAKRLEGVPHGTNWRTFKRIGDKVLISQAAAAGGGILVYNFLDDSIKQIYSSGASWSGLYDTGDGYLIYSTNNSSYGILFYDYETDTITKLYDTGYNYNNIYRLDDAWILSSSSSGSLGVLRYNLTTNTVTQLYDVGYQWRYFFVIGNKLLISGNQSSGNGILVYDIANGTLSKKYETGYNWMYFQQVGENCLITGGSSGVLLYVSSTDTIKQAYTTGTSWRTFKIVGNDCLISANTSSGGILLYNSDTETVTQKYSSGGYWDRFKIVGDNCLICGSQSAYAPGVLLYTSSTKTIVKKYASYLWNMFQEVEDNCLIFSPNGIGVLLYNSADGSVKLKYSKGQYDTAVLDGANCYISSTDERFPQKLYYTSADQSIKVVGWNLGEI